MFVKNNTPYRVLDYSFVRMQQGKPLAQLKVKNLISGKVLDFSVHQKESFKEAEIEIVSVIFIYNRNKEYWFHELENPKKRFFLEEKMLGNEIQYLKKEMELRALNFEGKVIGIEMPIKMDFEVTEAPPSIRKSTAQGGVKSVIIETGAKINTPAFINTGDTIRINTSTGEYVERTGQGKE